MSKRKPYNDRAGYVASLRSGPFLPDGKRGWGVIYEASEQGIDVGGARYAVVCETHGSILAERTLKGARLSLRNLAEFCEGCRECGTPPKPRTSLGRVVK